MNNEKENIVQAPVAGASQNEASDLQDISIDELSKKIQATAEDEENIKGRILKKWEQNVLYWTSIVFVLFQLLTAGFGELGSFGQRCVHLSFALIVTYISKAANRKAVRTKMQAFDWIIMAIGVVAMIFAFVNTDYIFSKPIFYPKYYIVMGALALLVVLEGCRRQLGPIFPSLVLIFMFYAFFGYLFPGKLFFKGLGLQQVFSTVYLNTSGLFGSTVSLSATTIATFVIFGALLLHSGAGETFFKLAMWLTGNSTGGAAKVAVISSALFGTISGSAAANVATTGTFTIPLMKKSGFNPEFAGGVEAVASTGGQIMPPIMGSGAFVMAEFLGLAYNSVAIMAIAPAVIYFGGIFLGVHLEAKKNKLEGKIEVPKASEFMKLGALINLFVPIGVLIALFVAGYSCGKAAFIASLLTIAMPVVTELIPGKRTFNDYIKSLGKGCQAAAATMANIGMLVACADVVCGLISISGLTVKLSNLIIGLAGSSLLIALLLTAVVVIILGMGLPTTAAYVLGAAVLGPALIGLGLDPIPAHFFIFFYSILGTITPPVCAGVFIGSGIAGADWLKTAKVAMSLGVAAYLMPFSWIYDPSLLLVNCTTFDFIVSVMNTALSVMAIGIAFRGYWGGEVKWYFRAAFIVLGILLLTPNSIWSYIEQLLVVLLAAALLVKGRKNKAAAA